MNTNQSYAYGEDEASPYDSGTVAAIFDTRDDAKRALEDLHQAGFHKTWMGVTHVQEYEPADLNAAAPAVAPQREVETAEGGGFGASLARFFGEDDRQSLYEALTKRGVPSSDALALDERMHGGGAVITVEAEGRYDDVLQILTRDRGDVASDSAGLGRATVADTSGAGATGVEDARTMQLREERLSVDKDRVAAGEATIGKRVVTQDASVDVPVMHEELFIQRRPVSGEARAASGTIDAGETIRIPLMRERVVVDKRTVVREEVAIGKRAVAGSERVDATVRHEELVVDGNDTKTLASAAPEL